MKTCARCDVSKEHAHFSPSGSNKDGLQSYCKQCSNAAHREWYKNNRSKELSRVNGLHRSLRYRYSQFVSRAKQRNIEVSITLDQWSALISSGSCEYCLGTLDVTGCALDRKDSALHYTLENVVPCCGACNTSKNNLYTYVEFKHIAEAIRVVKKAREWRT